MFRVTFPKNYVVCEGHEWFRLRHEIEADGTTTYRKDECRHCGLMVARGFPGWLNQL